LKSSAGSVGASQVSSGRERPLCQQRHLSNIFRLTIPNPIPNPKRITDPDPNANPNPKINTQKTNKMTPE